MKKAKKPHPIGTELKHVVIVEHRYGHSGTSNPTGLPGCDHSFTTNDELYGLEIRVNGSAPTFVCTGDPVITPDLSALALFGARFVVKNHGFNATEKLKELFKAAADQWDLQDRIEALAKRK